MVLNFSVHFEGGKLRSSNRWGMFLPTKRWRGIGANINGTHYFRLAVTREK